MLVSPQNLVKSQPTMKDLRGSSPKSTFSRKPSQVAAQTLIPLQF
jgi:hypothetical protein